MQANALRTSLRDEVKLDATSFSNENRGVRAWSSVELPGSYWIQARRTEIAASGEYETRQWLTCNFLEALRFGRGEGVVRFSLFVGVFTPGAASGFVFGEVTEVLRSVPGGGFVVRYGNGFSIMLARAGDGEDLSPSSFEPLYRADAWRMS